MRAHFSDSAAPITTLLMKDKRCDKIPNSIGLLIIIKTIQEQLVGFSQSMYSNKPLKVQYNL